MPELTITPAQTPVSGGAANANALSQSDAPSRSGESQKTDTENGEGSPFSAVLKSRMDKTTSADDVADSSAATAATSPADPASTAAGLDLSALLPLLGITPAATASVTTEPVAITEQARTIAQDALQTALPGLQVAAGAVEVAPTQTLATAAPATLMNAGSRKRQESGSEASASVGDAKVQGGVQAPVTVSGKIAPDAAINADAGRQNGEVAQPEIPAGDFRALMDRAAAMTSGMAGAANGASPNSGLRIDTPLGQNGWHEEMGQKLTWMLGNNRQQADLVLTPPQLGRVEVSLTMNGDQATAIFTSPNPAVREALEASLQRLREVLADAGVSLGQAQVGSESPNQSSRKDGRGVGVDEGVRYASAAPLAGLQATAMAGAGRGMIDIFA